MAATGAARCGATKQLPPKYPHVLAGFRSAAKRRLPCTGAIISPQRDFARFSQHLLGARFALRRFQEHGQSASSLYYRDSET